MQSWLLLLNILSTTSHPTRRRHLLRVCSRVRTKTNATSLRVQCEQTFYDCANTYFWKTKLELKISVWLLGVLQGSLWHIDIRSMIRYNSNGLFTLHGNGARTGTGNKTERNVVQKCSHWSQTGKRTRIHCFLLCWSSCLCLFWSRSRAVWISHKIRHEGLSPWLRLKTLVVKKEADHNSIVSAISQGTRISYCFVTCCIFPKS